MGTGYLQVQTDTAGGFYPVAGARVIIRKPSAGTILYETTSNENGRTKEFALPAPAKELSQNKNYNKPAYTLYDVDVMADGFITRHIHGVQILDTLNYVLPVHMHPLLDEFEPPVDEEVYIPAKTVASQHAYHQRTAPTPMLQKEVFIPDYITVHLGKPSVASQDVRIPFVEYVANVCTHEIYATWPQNALIVNIHVITTFALNRVFTEWYRVQNRSFDITNSTQYDQYYVHGGGYNANVMKLAQEYFNMYARRYAFLDPFFTEFCDGKVSDCAGLKQWETPQLANNGMTPLQILHKYYPNDLELVRSNLVKGIVESFPGTTLMLGSKGDDVLRMQKMLNRIVGAFPGFPFISNPNGVFERDMETYVFAFQREFNLTVDGKIGRATWNKISFIFLGVTKLAEYTTEGMRVSIGKTPPNVTIELGSVGPYVKELQFILSVLSQYYAMLSPMVQDGKFGALLKNAVIAFQREFGLTQDGRVGIGTWNKLYAVYRGIAQNVPVAPVEPPPSNQRPPFPGTSLTVGSTGANVRQMQLYLNAISIVYNTIPSQTPDSIFGQSMKNAVVAFQREFWLTPDGVIGAMTWNKIVEVYLLIQGEGTVSTEYPGTPLRVGSKGSSVQLMQSKLSDLRRPYPSLPAVTVDGVFGANTESAVRSFQRLMGLTADGVIGPTTWYAIIREHAART